ncbi:MAG: PQQ-dependent sugar dehydrogenase [Thermoleophilaceae bacterium]
MTSTRVLLALAISCAGLVAGCGGNPGDSSPGGASASQSPAGAAKDSVRTIATGLHVPWGIAFLPGRNGDALVAERTTGRIVRIARPGGRKKVVMRVPGVDTGAGEGGLLGLAVSPDYAKDKLVYAYFTSSNDNRIVRFKLGGRTHTVLKGLESAPVHNGGRIAFGPDRKLYATVGDAGNTGNAQSRSSQNGKILRMNPVGSVPAGNPIPGSRIWSLGHRNPQGIAWDAKGRLWAAEFGQNKFDEVNLIHRGKNYGWPIVEGRGSTRGGKFVNPKVAWRTDEASPSGVAIARSRLYVGALQGHGVFRIRLKGTSAGKPVKLLGGRYGRIRTAVKAPDGSIWISTSNRDGRGEPKKGDDRIVRIK